MLAFAYASLVSLYVMFSYRISQILGEEKIILLSHTCQRISGEFPEASALIVMNCRYSMDRIVYLQCNTLLISGLQEGLMSI